MTSKDTYELPSEHVARCCWCSAPLVLEERVNDTDPQPPAWCSGSQECRDRQAAAGINEVDADGKVHWLFLPTPRQVERMVSKVKNLFIWGNRGGGKSVCIRWLCHALAMAIPGFKYQILRTSFVELNKNHLIYLDDEMAKFGKKDKSYYHSTDHICYYPNGSIGFYGQCETDADVKKVLGAEVYLVVFDEAPTFQWHHMRLIGGSVRAPKGSRIRPLVRYLGNPTGESIDELFSYCVDKDVVVDDSEDGDDEYDPADWDSIEMRLEDNPHLDYKEYRKQFAGLPKHIRKAWLDGVRAEERTMFEFYPSKFNAYTGTVEPYHVIHELPRLADDTPVLRFNATNGEWEHPTWMRIYRAYDDGFKPDPAYMLWFAIVGRLIVCFREQWWYSTIAKDIARDVLGESRGMSVVTTYCDPSIDIKGSKDIYTLKQDFENLGVPMDCAVNDRALFAKVIHQILGEEIGPHQPRIVFYDKGCPQLIKNLPRMKWDEHDPTKMAEHKHDHGPVTFAYFAMSQIPGGKSSTAGGKVHRWMKPKVKPKRR